MEEVALHHEINNTASNMDCEDAESRHENTYIETILGHINTLSSICINPLKDIVMDAISDTGVDYSTKVENIYSTCNIVARLRKIFKKVAIKTGEAPLLDELPTQIVHALCDHNGKVAKVIFDQGLLGAGQQEDEVRDNLNQFVEPILRDIIRGTIYASCGLMDRIPDTPATAERNKFIGTILNDRMIKVEAKLNKYMTRPE